MKPVTLVEEHFPSFFEVPFAVYGDRYPFVSPLESDLKAMLDRRENPLFSRATHTYFTALRGKRPVGRIVCLVHRAANERWNERCASFGFFDCANDPDVAGLLLDEAVAFARAHGCTRLRGNMNLTANQEIGVLVEGEQRAPYLAQLYNPEYLGGLLERYGFSRTHPMTSFVHPDVARADTAKALSPKAKALLGDRTWRFRDFRLDRFDDDVEHVRTVLNDAMADNYLFVPLSEAETKFQLGSLKLVMDPALIKFAEHQGEVVGVHLCVPNVVPLLQKMKSRLFPLGWARFLLERKKVRTATSIIILVKKAFQGSGVIGVLNHLVMEALKQGGYTSLGGTWIGDDNGPSLKAAKAIGMQPWHRLFMYERAL